MGSRFREDAKEIATDFAKDKAAESAPAIAYQATMKFEQGRRLLQIGTVPGAKAAYESAKIAGAKGGALFRAASRAPAIQAGIELGKGAYLVGNRDARKGHAEAGKRIEKEPVVTQAARMIVSPADTLSKLGAVREERGRKAMDKKQTAFASSGVGQANDMRNKMIEQRSKDTQEILSRPKQSQFRTQIGAR